MKKLLQNKKLVILLSIVLAAVLAAGAGILVWQLTKDDAPDTYTVRFVTNGGNEIEPMKVEKGTVLSQTDLPVPSKPGELFLTWTTDEALTVPYWNAPIESDMTLYALYVEPADDAKETELVQSVIPFADTDFNVSVRSTVELTDDNIGNYVVLTVNYGKHENGEEIKLSVRSEGNDIYRISGNFAAGGDYIISLISSAVTFDPDDATLAAYGLTEALRILRFRIIGEDYMNGELSDKVADIPEEDIAVKDSDSVIISGNDHALIGATMEENGVICVGDGDDISDYKKIVGIEAASADEVTYTVRPAKVEEVYDHVIGYQWESLGGDDYAINEEVKAQVIEEIANNDRLNNYVKYLTLAATQTQTYKTMSTEQFGEVVAMPMNAVMLPSGIVFDLDFDVYNENFVDIIGEEYSDGFAKLTLGIQYEHRIAKLGKMGSVTALIELQIDFWLYFGMGGEFEIGWFSYDIDYGASTMMQTDITFTIGLMTSDSKKVKNIDDELEAIFESAKDPTPENLLEQYNELMGGNSTPITLFDQRIFDIPVLSLLYGAVEISVPVTFVVTLDVEASFTSHVSVLTSHAFGIQGDDDKGLDTYYESLPTRYMYRLELKGRIELRAGVELGIKLSLGFDLASVSMNVQTGFYGEIHGYFFYEVESMDWRTDRSTNRGGAYYFEFGVYVDIRLRAEVCIIKYSGSLWDKKWPIYSAGQKEIVYGFVNPTGDEILMEGNQRSVNIEDTGILDVYVYDITKERSDNNPRIVKNYPFSDKTFDWYLSNGNFIVYERVDGKGRSNYEIISVESLMDGGFVSEAILTLNFTGVQISFRDTLTKQVTLKYSYNSDVDWDNIDKIYKVDFTVDGKVIFTREIPFGHLITDQPTLFYQVNNDGKIVSNLRSTEMEDVYNSGYADVTWQIQSGEPLFVTADMSIEAVHNDNEPERRKLTVTIADMGQTEVRQAQYGEQIELPLPAQTRVVTKREIHEFAGWRAEDGTVYFTSEPYTVTNDVTLTVQYNVAPRKYEVTFDGNGGTVGNGDTFTTSAAYGNMPVYPFTPVREATATTRYVFAGWSPALSPVTEDVTYTAQWKEIKRYTVTFDAGKGQFDASGKNKITITVDEGHTLSASDIPMDPYIKTNNGYYDFEAWSAAVSVGTVINGNVTYTATYKNELTVRTGVTVSDGVNTEDIAAFLDGTSKISGYRYILNAENFGNTLEITAPGLTISGEETDLHVVIKNTDVTLKDLTLSYTGIGHINTQGKVNIAIDGTVRIATNRGGDALRGDGMENPTDPNGYIDANVTLCGADESSKLIIDSKEYGIAVYGKLTVEDLAMDLTVVPHEYDMAVAIQSSDRLTLKDSDVVVHAGLVSAAQLDLTNSDLTFMAQTFTPGYTDGIYMMNHYNMTENGAIITLTNAHISFTHDIAIAIAVTMEDDSSYYINTSMEANEIISSYPSLDAFLADVNTKGYSGMVVTDTASSIT